MAKLPQRLSLEFLLLGLIAVAVLLRILYLGSREFWYDEVLSLLVATGQGTKYQHPGDLPVVLNNYKALLSLPAESSVGDAIETIKNIFKSLFADVHPPLSFLSLHFWLRLFGNSEAATRSLMALLSVGAIGGAYGLGRVLLGHRGGLLLAALLGINPFFLFHSLNLRMYAPLVLWTVLSSWAILQLMEGKPPEEGTSKFKPLLWNVLLIGSVAAGLLTQYLFAYWVLTLGIFVLVFDRPHWWQQGLRLSAGVLLTIPWFLWGARRQGRLDDVGGQFLQGNHLGDITQTLGTHLLLGDWATSLPIESVMVAGVLVIALLVTCIINLWRQGERRPLFIALFLGFFPLLLALLVDIIGRKHTIGFGGGRALIFILPGCLLLLALGLERSAGRWRGLAATVLLLVYLSLSIGDFSLRHRRMFHNLADLIREDSTTPTLVIMNSRAWGHVLRLAYYLPSEASVMLLARDSAKLAPNLEKILNSPAAQYPRLIWLNSARPVWSAPKTDAEKQQYQQAVQQVVDSQYQLTKTLPLSGTMELDKFTVNLYRRSAEQNPFP